MQYSIVQKGSETWVQGPNDFLANDVMVLKRKCKRTPNMIKKEGEAHENALARTMLTWIAFTTLSILISSVYFPIQIALPLSFLGSLIGAIVGVVVGKITYKNKK
jgi:hypothetical protein